MMRKLISMLLVLAMVLSLAACGPAPEPDPTTQPSTSAPTTEPATEPTTEPTTVPTEPEPTPAELYAEAVGALSSYEAFQLSVNTHRTLTINGTSYVEESEQHIDYNDYWTDAPNAHVSETVNIDNYITTYTEWFGGSTLSTTIDDTYHFQGTMTAEEYMARFAPLIMLDAALYGEIAADGNTLTFSAPTAGESWIVPEYAEFVDASGTATLNNDGGLTGYTYDMTYAIGGAEIHYEIDMSIKGGSNIVYETQPEISYIELEYVDAPRLMEQAAGYLWQANGDHAVTVSLAESTISYAGGVILNKSQTLNAWGSAADYMADLTVSAFQMTANGEYSYEQEEHLQDGVYTYSADGSEPEESTSVTTDDFQTYCAGIFVNLLPPMAMLNEAAATDLGSIYYLELTLSEEYAQAINGTICNMFWSDEEFLNDLADKYRTESMEGYLAIDKNTGLPISVGCYYEGYHTIEGNDYMLSYQADQSFDLASTSAYETIAEEPPVPAEPEEKATPLFYHVTGENGEEMWLLGTIHIGDARTSYLPQEIYDAFDAADALAVEFNSEAFDEEMENNEELSDQVSGNYFYDDGTMTADHVDSELFEYAEKLMKATGNYHMNAPYMKVTAWGNSIDNFYTRQSYDLSSTQGVDNQLIWRAESQGKTILDVESGLFQIQMLMGFSDALQEQLLYESVYADPYAYAEGTRELFEMWCAGDEAALIAYLNEEPDTSDLTEEELALIEEYNNAMGTDRNDDMLDVAIGYLESGDVVFYAVGLAHLLAEDGLVNTLRDAGYTVELVPYE